MLYLKEANFEDVEKEFEFVKNTPKDENGFTMAIDIFEGDLKGLAYLEIEFENKEMTKNYEVPNWVIKDVTTDLQYKNGHLSRYGIPNSFYEYIKDQ